MRALAAVAAALAVVLPGGAPGRGSGPAPPAPGADVATVVLTVRHSRFTPASVAVPEGSAVRFVVRNLDPIDHELIVGGPAVHRHHAVGRDAHHHGDVPGEVSVAAGATAVTTWRPPGPGRFTFACHLPGHLAYGMAGTVVVGGGATSRS